MDVDSLHPPSGKGSLWAQVGILILTWHQVKPFFSLDHTLTSLYPGLELCFNLWMPISFLSPLIFSFYVLQLQEWILRLLKIWCGLFLICLCWSFLGWFIPYLNPTCLTSLPRALTWQSLQISKSGNRNKTNHKCLTLKSNHRKPKYAPVLPVTLWEWSDVNSCV